MLRRILLISSILLIAWFIPWVFMLYTGVLAYFPYEANGKDRYLRITGPVVKWIDNKHPWVAADDIPNSCKAALVRQEDQRFYEHWGFDIEGIKYALRRNQRRGKIRLGGSTITQQLVKNAFLSRDRSYVRKVRELVGAVMLDVIMSKDNQLMWYFNVVEYGPRIYGLGAAARYYYRKPAQRLSAAECEALVTVLPSPRRYGKAITR